MSAIYFRFVRTCQDLETMLSSAKGTPRVPKPPVLHDIALRRYEVILPLSPNHGLFGNDGLHWHSESKTSLKTLFQCWASESWGEYLCLAGAVIGYVYNFCDNFIC
jgi:hypothetical protein